MIQKVVPQSIIDMALAALEHLPEEFALEGVTYSGIQSAYTYSFVRNGEPVDIRLGYDFGNGLSEEARGEKLAAEVRSLLGIESLPVQNIEPSLADSPQIIFDSPEAEQAFYEALAEADEPVDYESMSVAELKELAAAVGIDLPARPKKPEIIAALIEYDAAHTTPQGEEETE